MIIAVMSKSAIVIGSGFSSHAAAYLAKQGFTVKVFEKMLSLVAEQGFSKKMVLNLTWT